MIRPVCSHFLLGQRQRAAAPSILDPMPDKEIANILIVDDEASVRDVLKRALAEEGYNCAVAVDVESALHILSSSPVDLVLSDIMMPGKSGVDLLKEISARWPDIVTIMLTAVANTRTAIEAMKLGAYDYVMKPFNLDEVRLGAERALEKRNLILANREYREFLELKVEEQTVELRETFIGSMKALAEALEAKDTYTNGHTHRVTEIAVAMAREKGLPEEEIARIRLAGQVHDIGKIGIPEEVLRKTGKLTDAEFDLIREHVVLSERILKPIIKDEEVLAMVRFHHERYDGRGYPDGLAGEDIPFGARLLAVADAYDAMTSNRPYRPAMTPEKARSQLLAGRGSQFDPEAVDILIEAEEKMSFCPISAAPAGEKRPQSG